MKTIKRTSLPLFLIVILMGVFACALPAIPPVDQNAGGTSVALTVAAIIQATQDAANPISVVASDTPAFTLVPADTFTPQPPTFTATATLTSTSTLRPTPIFSVTPLTPMISVSVPTNCRVGPGKVYEMVGALLVDHTVQVYARDPGGNYWYIRNPDDPTHFCWVWGEYATVAGPVLALPVYTPPPSPTPTLTSTPSPAFDASFSGLDSCSGWWVDIELKNHGLVAFQSISLTVKDTVTSTVVSTITNGFTDKTGCASTLKKTLLPGKTVTASSPNFSYDVTGHKLKTTITLCSGTGLNGICVTQTITFKP